VQQRDELQQVLRDCELQMQMSKAVLLDVVKAGDGAPHPLVLPLLLSKDWCVCVCACGVQDVLNLGCMKLSPWRGAAKH
jgi:hypothetical protein